VRWWCGSRALLLRLVVIVRRHENCIDALMLRRKATSGNRRDRGHDVVIESFGTEWRVTLLGV
jgi:hypothetical protein